MLQLKNPHATVKTQHGQIDKNKYIKKESLCAKSLQSCPFVTVWTVSWQAALSMGLSRQEYWSGLPCPPPGDFLDPGIKPGYLMSPALAGRFFTISTTWGLANNAP